MNYTNQYDIPEFLAAQLRVRRAQQRNISVTQLIKPPRVLQLERRYDEEITIDVSNNLWAWFGTAMHLVLEDAAKGKEMLSEEQLSVEVGGWKINGRPDLLLPECRNLKLVDLKTMSVWSYLLEKGHVKPEHEQQLNIYRHMFQANGFRADYLEVWAILKDWRRGESRKDPDYPPIPFVRIKVPMWEDKQAADFLAARVGLHQAAAKVDDSALPMCTPDERWRRPSTWAVMKGTNIKAMRVLPSPEEAKAWVEQSNDKTLRIVERPGVDNRCTPEFCHGAPWCSYYQQTQKEDAP